ncbi:hypothetical protein ACQ4PT_004874 [Festuca glaucescens]
MSQPQPATTTRQHRPIEQQASNSFQKEKKGMKIVTEPRAVVVTNNEDDATTAEVTQDAAEAMKKSESETELEESEWKSEGSEHETSDASNALQAVMVFEDAEYFGAKFESFWNRLFRQYSAYDETTTIPAMCYTHGNSYADDVRAMDTLQVVSVKVASIEEGLHWPLQVFGMVSARDVLDRKRNIIFHRERDDCQTITEKDPYLTLTGPSRAVVVCIDPSYIEIVLKVKGSNESEDKELSRLDLALRYRLSSLINGLYPSELSTLELIFTQEYSSVEATVHVKVIGGSWPDGFKGVFSAATARSESVKVKLLDVGDDGLLVDAADAASSLLS